MTALPEVSVDMTAAYLACLRRKYPGLARLVVTAQPINPTVLLTRDHLLPFLRAVVGYGHLGSTILDHTADAGKSESARDIFLSLRVKEELLRIV